MTGDGRLSSLRRGALAALAALTLTILCVAASAYFCASDAARYERHTLRYGDYQALGMDEDAARAFARHTMAFLRGSAENWTPEVGFEIGADFRAHMQSVRGIFQAAPWALMGLGIVSAGWLVAAARGGRKGIRLSRPGWYVGMALGLMPLVALALWALCDFPGFWLWLHERFLPDGLFSSQEAVMRLFPPELFAAYGMPVGVGVAVGLTVVGLVPVSRTRR